MKKIDISKYHTLKVGTHITVETAGIVGETVTIHCRKGKLVSVSTRWKEIRKDDKPTGLFEQLASTLVFEPDINTIEDPQLGTLHIIATVVGCGLFRIYTEE